MTDPVGWSEGHRLVADLGHERNLVDRIKAERRARGWSQADLAKRVNLHQSAISKLESDQRERGVTIRDALAFARAFDLPLGELLLPANAVPNAAVWKDFVAAAEVRNRIRHETAAYDDLLLGLRKDVRASADFADRLRAHRIEVMADFAEEHARAFPDEKATPELLEANRPPVVIVIDDVLKGVDDE